MTPGQPGRVVGPLPGESIAQSLLRVSALNSRITVYSDSNCAGEAPIQRQQLRI
jgi:hypothetical protein